MVYRYLKVLTLICLCIAMTGAGTAKDQCMHEGAVFQNNTWWKRNACTTCFCHNGIITCEQIKCKDPQCDSTQGHSLTIPANQCCPVCSNSSKQYCVRNGDIIAHNTRWETENCTIYTCDDGIIVSTLKKCARKRCGYGEVLKHVSGHCCPLCVSIGDSCTDEGKSYNDGETWSPTFCERASCKNGEVIRSVAQCGNLVCRQDEKAVIPNGMCCPTCVGRSCIYEGHEYSSGEQFRHTQCENCICRAGEVQCQSHFCNSTNNQLDTGCPSGTRRITRETGCCPECVSTQASCEYHGRSYFHGDLWNISKCEVAYCHHGNVRSSYVQCTTIQCNWNEKLVHKSCCPECIPVTSSCLHTGYEYRHGDMWKSGLCQTCECSYGTVQCFTANCPICPPRTVPVKVPGECCPDCQPVDCHADCLTCSAPGYGHCLTCPPNRVLQEGKCVHHCMGGFYQEGKECLACHRSCASCTLGNSPSTCMSCERGKLLQKGRCVRECETGFYRYQEQCSVCPKGCSSCFNLTHCLTCIDRTKLPQGGACVRQCGRGYFYFNGVCQDCHPSCTTCSGSGNECLSCSAGRLLENGLCVAQCSAGFFQLSISRCGACHKSCATCRGSLENQCLSCVESRYLYNSKCISSCPPRYYAINGQCRACHSSCLACIGNSANHCTKCMGDGEVVQPSKSQSHKNHGTCRSVCNDGYYLDIAICKACSDHCSTCTSLVSCSKCKKNFALSLTTPTQDFQQCVSKRDCVNRGFVMDSDSLYCYNATLLSHCSHSSGRLLASNSTCVSECPSKTFSKEISAVPVCLHCGDRCSGCTETGNCLKCEKGNVLSHITSKCLETCEPGFYAWKGKCLKCPEGCGTCIATSSPQPRCTSCMSADAVLQHGQCLSYCVQQFYPDRKSGNMGTPVCRECDWSCTSCSGPSAHDCLECMESHMLQNGTCVPQCSEGFFPSSIRCLSCSDRHCAACSEINQCSRCKASFFLHNSRCVRSCPRGYVGDSNTHSCAACPQHCLECSSVTNCTQCNDRTYLIQSLDPLGETSPSSRSRSRSRKTECVRQCGRGYTGSRNTRRCQANRLAPEIKITGPMLVRLGSRALVNVMAVSDQDTSMSEILVTLTMEPANGWFENNRTKLTAESSMPYKEIVQGNLWFVHDATKQRHGVATFQASDGSLTSETTSLDLVAVPQYKPIVTKNELVLLRVGESSKITSRSCFDVSYDGKENSVKLTLPYQPKHGKLVKLPNYETPIDSFKVADLNSGVLLYVANSNLTSSNETHYDSIVLQITDGYHVINNVINVNVMPKESNSTLVVTHKGTRVRSGGMTQITNQHLLTIAPNIKDKSNIVYVLRPKKGERKGKLVMMVPELSDAPMQHGIGVNEWSRTRQGQYQSPSVVRFTQRDVDNGYVWFSDQSTGNDNNQDESFELMVYDDSSTTSRPLGRSTLQMTRFHDNSQPPHLSPGLSAPLHMSASEGMVTILHNGFLRFTDQDTPDRDILYNITRPLPSVYGQIENDDRPHVPITVFTQSDIDSNKIIYRPPVGGLPGIQYELGRRRTNQHSRYAAHSALDTSSAGEPQLKFEFTVSDGDHVLPPTNFSINLVSSSSAPPSWGYQLSLLRVSQGGTAVIGALQLSVTDPDTPSDELVFTLVKEPRQGTVVQANRGSRTVRVGDTFTNDDIHRGSIMYVHGGGRLNPTDQIQVSVSDGIHSVVAVIQVDITQTEHSLAPSPDPYTELAVVVEASSEVTLTRENLAYIDRDSEDNQIVYHIDTESFHGILKNNEVPVSPGSTFTQREINQGMIKYTSVTDIGSLPFTDTMHFHVIDSSENVLPNQVLKITITPARSQHAPVVAVGEPIVVGSGKEVRISTENIIVSDPDTPSHELIVKILRKPSHGNIINKKTEARLPSQQMEDVWFYLSDLTEGFVYYAHSRDLAGTQDHFTFHVKDDLHISPTYTATIYIEVAHARPLLHSSPIQCQDGHAILINSNSLTVVDRDTPNRDLVFTLSSPLHYGKLVKFQDSIPHNMRNGWKLGMSNGAANNMKMKQATDLRLGSTFTYQDILDQLICYENTVPEPARERGPRSRRETVNLELSDGASHQSVEMLIDIEPELTLRIQTPPPLNFVPPHPAGEEHRAEELRGNDADYELEDLNEEEMEADEMRKSELVVEANTGMTVERGSVTTITSKQLRVTGTDRTISYVITRDPNVGKLQYARNDNVEDLCADEDNQFTQEEIDEGSIRYNHPISEGGGDVFFKFDVIGGDVDLRFDIHVNEDQQPPRILVNRALNVQEGGSQRITTQDLSASDESNWLVYDITRPAKLGRLERLNNAGTAVSRFTQADLEAENIRYVHTSESERTEDQFTFSLTDGTNSVVQVFNIHVELVDNSLPVLENHGIRVQEGVRKTITEFELKATDRDTSNDLVRFTVVTPAQHGTIDRTTNGRRYVPVTSFSMDDVYESRISYNHDGTNSLTDTFSFKVSDGTNEQFVLSAEENPVTTTEAQLFHIQVVPVDDGTPRLITNLGLNHLEYVDNKALSPISKHILLTEDPDTEPNRIIYTVTSNPRHGYLESTRRGGQPISSFTQADINANLIRYVLSNTTSDVTRDSFMFNVRDSLPNVVTGNTFNIRWSVISFDKSNYTVDENVGTVDVTVVRRGNLNQYAIVLCRTEHGSATASSSTSTGLADYVEHAGQVQFDAYETEKICSITINDDTIFEGTESFTVQLAMPTDTLLGDITMATVYINDERDAPTLQFMETQYTVEERDTTVTIPIKRTGDVEKPVTVVCYTEAKSATGTTDGQVQSGSDYKSRGRHSEESIITFSPGVSQENCIVKIIDDSLYEDSEEFLVKITSPSQEAQIGKFAKATVTITGPNDSPTVFLTNSRFVFPETAGTVDIPVHRTGTDLSMSTDVWCSTKQTDPVSAQAGQDFVATSTKITFRPEETAKICTMTVLDDSQNPTVEGNETFIVYLNSVQKAKLSPPHEATVIINDTLDDEPVKLDAVLETARHRYSIASEKAVLPAGTMMRGCTPANSSQASEKFIPTFQFLDSSVEVEENSGVVKLPIQRVGDVSSRASVICYTRQDTALVEEDFVERPRTEMSRIAFAEGQRVAHCNVTLVDDGQYEANEAFTVRLGDATGEKWYGARVGESDRVRVTVTNDEDAPTLQFQLSEYIIREPDSVDATRQLTVNVVRTGDPSEVSKVRCSTRDGSAKSGSDYEPKSRLLRFQPGETSVSFEVNILSNEDAKWHETFMIVLGPQEPVNAVLGDKFETTVTILGRNAAGSSVLPDTPVVVSLLHYDNVKLGLESNPSPGYPIVCVTPCDPKYPNYVETSNLCEQAAINTSAIRFSWEVAMPTDEQNGVPPFETVTDNTPFTSVNTKVLDSIYFGRRFNVRCVAQVVDAVTHNGGTPLRSNVVTIATDSGICHSQIVSGSTRNFQAQNFMANLNYNPPTAEEHPNTLHVSVEIPHQDGRLPLISTMPLNNLKLLLSRSVDRQQHVCSNLMYAEDGNSTNASNLGTGLGFIEKTDYSKLSLGPGHDKPYQFDPTVREPKSIDLYKYLNLKSCLWQFDAYYHLNELIDFCNGKAANDFELRDAAASQVTVTVPLHVSYVYVTAPRGWGALEHQTEMEVAFRYNNVLWRTGIQTDGVLSGRLQEDKIKIREDGKLVIKFKTQTKFRGLFVQEHRTLPTRKARVIPPEGMNIAFDLELLWSEHTYDSPYQHWQAVSTYSRKDYSGEYTIELLPCVVSPTQRWVSTSGAIPCTASAPEKFKIPIMFQQANRPVPVVYTLETEFQLCNNEKVFMMDPNDYDQNVEDYDYKGSFTKGQTIFGRVLWTPQQDLKDAYRLKLDKVYLCTGRDGYVPYFDPSGEIYHQGPQHGCIIPSNNLQHRFLLLDRSNRDAEHRNFHDVSFDAHFASDMAEYADMAHLSGVDGFLLKVDALYKVEAGHQWYIQVLYDIESEKSPRVKRSAVVDFSNKILSRRRRSDDSGRNNLNGSAARWRNGLKSRNGTNMRGVNIKEPDGSPSPIIIGIACSVVGLVVILGTVLCCCLLGGRKKRKRKEKDLKMIELKTIALEKGCDSDDEWSGEKTPVSVVKVDKNHVRLNNRDDINSAQSLLPSKRLAKVNKPNNVRESEKLLLKNHSKKKSVDLISNNLKENSDSGTEV